MGARCSPATAAAGGSEIAALENPATIALLGALPDLMFVDVERISRVDERLKELFAPAELRRVVDALDAAHQTGTLRGFLKKSDPGQLLRWIAHRSDELDDEPISTLSALPIYPSSTGPAPLTELKLPGSFGKDPLGIAKTVDLTGIEELRPFLGDDGLGADTLDLDVYVLIFSPPRLRMVESSTRAPSTSYSTS